MERVLRGAAGKGRGAQWLKARASEFWGNAPGNALALGALCLQSSSSREPGAHWCLYTAPEHFLKCVSSQAQFVGLITSTTDVFVSTLRNSIWNSMSNATLKFKIKSLLFCSDIMQSLCNSLILHIFVYFLSLCVAPMTIIHYYYLHILCTHTKVL